MSPETKRIKGNIDISQIIRSSAVYILIHIRNISVFAKGGEQTGRLNSKELNECRNFPKSIKAVETGVELTSSSCMQPMLTRRPSDLGQLKGSANV